MTTDLLTLVNLLRLLLPPPIYHGPPSPSLSLSLSLSLFLSLSPSPPLPPSPLSFPPIHTSPFSRLRFHLCVLSFSLPPLLVLPVEAHTETVCVCVRSLFGWLWGSMECQHWLSKQGSHRTALAPVSLPPVARGNFLAWLGDNPLTGSKPFSFKHLHVSINGTSIDSNTKYHGSWNSCEDIGYKVCVCVCVCVCVLLAYPVLQLTGILIFCHGICMCAIGVCTVLLF